MAFIIVLVLLREHLLCFFDLKIYNKNVHIWDSLHCPTEFLFLLSKSVRTVYADVITKFYGIARFPVLNFYPMIAMGFRYNKKKSVYSFMSLVTFIIILLSNEFPNFTLLSVYPQHMPFGRTDVSWNLDGTVLALGNEDG